MALPKNEFYFSPQLLDAVMWAFPGVDLKIDSELAMYERFVPTIGKTKFTTVRYGRDKIRIPGFEELPFFMTKENDKAFKERIGTVRVPHLAVKRFGELTLPDARNDGFQTLEELTGEIKSIYTPIYGDVRDDDFVSIYRIIMKE